MSSTVLGKSLLEAVECSEATVDNLLLEMNIPSKLRELSLQKLSETDNDLVVTLLASISEIEGTYQEPAESILAKSTRAIFSYGTLRADMTADGDKWGVITGFRTRGINCVWHYGEIKGYSLHQTPGLTYPFATPSHDGQIFGTVLTWPDRDDVFTQALQRCNSIEAWVPSGEGLYMRDTVTVSTEDAGEIEAYVYYQTPSGDDYMASCLHFPRGDWLSSRRSSKIS